MQFLSNISVTLKNITRYYDSQKTSVSLHAMVKLQSLQVIVK